MMRSRAAFVLAVCSLATSCLGRGPAAGVSPPPKADPALTARVGLVVATNSPSFRRLLHDPRTTGVVVAFVQPRGPADRRAIRAGDVITSIDGREVANGELAVSLLRSRPGQRRRLELVRNDAATRTVTVTAARPETAALGAMLSTRLHDAPDDPVLNFLRGQVLEAPGDYDRSVADLDRALRADDRFVEALVVRAERRWTHSRTAPKLSPSARRVLVRSALADWQRALRLEGNNTRALTGYARALAVGGQAAKARELAERARTLDPTFPSAQYVVALAAYIDKRYEDAAAPAREAVRLSPYNVDYYELLARTFRRLERSEDCERTITSIIDLIPSTAQKTQLLQTCR